MQDARALVPRYQWLFDTLIYKKGYFKTHTDVIYAVGGCGGDKPEACYFAL